MKKLFVIALGFLLNPLATLAQPAVKLVEYRFEVMPLGTQTSAPYYVNTLALTSASNMTFGPGLTGLTGYTAGPSPTPDKAQWADNWSPGGYDPNDYFSFTLTPIATYTLVVDSITFRKRISSTGPKTQELRSSLNLFSSSVWVSPLDASTSWKKYSVTSGLPSSSSALTFRLYGYGSMGPAGTLRIDSLRVYGHLDNIYNLPVELTRFNALPYNSVVKLDWSTATETNNDYFTVCRSNDLETWEEVTRVPGAGNSQSSISYETVDNKPFAGISYYKLQQTDFDGQSKDVGTVSVQMKETNSFTFLLYQEFSWEGQTTAIFDTSGRMISGWNTVHTLTSPGIFLLVTRQGETAKIHITP